jgi:hypothetical protein
MTMAKHWMQTVEGKRRMSEIMRKRHAEKKAAGESWVPKKKRRSKKVTQSFPLAIIPQRRVQTSARVISNPPKPVPRDMRLALAMALVGTVREILMDR